MELADDASKNEFMYMYVNPVLIDIHEHCKAKGESHGVMNTSTISKFLDLVTPFVQVYYDKDADYE